jgi:hypothetical protein
MTIRKTVVPLMHAFVGLALCAAAMGMTLISSEIIRIVHAIGALTFFLIVSLVYYKNSAIPHHCRRRLTSQPF